MEAGDCARAHATSNEMRPAARIAAIIFGSAVTLMTVAVTIIRGQESASSWRCRERGHFSVVDGRGSCGVVSCWKLQARRWSSFVAAGIPSPSDNIAACRFHAPLQRSQSAFSFLTSMLVYERPCAYTHPSYVSS